MYVNSSAATSGSYSLTFLGKKVGRRHSVAPAGKQIAWETTVGSSRPEDSLVSLQATHIPASAQATEDLPGSVPELKDKRPCPRRLNMFDQHEDNTTGVSGRKVTA
ncbi:hypothetical protein OJAV_G00091880 [Oryzias javanicus]|uniref:Uncharacterized protein n=1 Tax=Oryzias javanicus TaxID=123683 RepID=A0A3S2MWP9_ORYJA|nr:hypothetical protein OJAV_G00091880 [Oryzias javanicus]